MAHHQLRWWQYRWPVEFVSEYAHGKSWRDDPDASWCCKCSEKPLCHGPLWFILKMSDWSLCIDLVDDSFIDEQTTHSLIHFWEVKWLVQYCIYIAPPRNVTYRNSKTLAYSKKIHIHDFGALRSSVLMGTAMQTHWCRGMMNTCGRIPAGCSSLLSYYYYGRNLCRSTRCQ